MSHSRHSFRQRAHALVDRLPHDADWTDLADYAMARGDLEQNGSDGSVAPIAGEVLEEYEQIQSEVERSLACEDGDDY